MESRRRIMLQNQLLPLQALVAPLNFDATAQNINIHKLFSEYNNQYKSYCYSFSDTYDTLSLSASSGISYRYGYTRGGIDYSFDVLSITNPFTTSIDTKRWVIVNNTNTVTLSVVLPNGVVWAYISGYCNNISSYSNSTYLKYVHFVSINKLTTLPINAFIGCTSLAGIVNIPNTVTSMGNSCFYGCTQITGVLNISTSIASIPLQAFYSCTATTGSISIPSNITDIGGSAFLSCRFNGNLILPTGLLTIGNSAFNGCNQFTGNLTIPIGVSALGSRNFYNCTGFNGALTILNTSLTFSDAFSGCTNFTALNLPIGYSSTSLNFSFSTKFTADSLNQSILNLTDGTKTITIGATNKSRLLAAYPNAETNANARGITIV